MALSRSMVALFFFVLVIVTAAEMGTARVVAEERHCLSQSQLFQGVCISDTNCDTICKSEKFTGGKCKMDGMSRKCYCNKVC